MKTTELPDSRRLYLVAGIKWNITLEFRFWHQAELHERTFLREIYYVRSGNTLPNLLTQCLHKIYYGL